MENDLVSIKVDYLLTSLQSLMDEDRCVPVKKDFTYFSSKNLALNGKLDEERGERVLNFTHLSVEEIMKNLSCSELVAKKIKEKN